MLMSMSKSRWVWFRLFFQYGLFIKLPWPVEST